MATQPEPRKPLSDEEFWQRQTASKEDVLANLQAHHQWQIEQYTELMRRVSVGSPESTTLESIDSLEKWAARQGLEFAYNRDDGKWILQPIEEPTLQRCSYCQQYHEPHLIEQCPLKPKY